MKKVFSLLTLPLRITVGCFYTIREYIHLEFQIQKTSKQELEILDDLDTAIWLQAFDDQKILNTTKHYLETCYARSKSTDQQ